MRKASIIVIVLLLLSVVAVSQTATPAGTTPSKEEVLKFLDVLRVKSQLNQYFEGVSKQAKLGAEEGFKQKVPDATAEQLAEVDKFAENLFKGMPIDEMVDAMVPIYQKHLTKEDLEAILAFYATPAGKKLQREQPAMMQEAMQVGGEIGRRRINSMMQQLEDFIAKLAQQQKTPAKQ